MSPQAAPRGYVAEKIIFFDRCATPHREPVPTPLGRHLLPTGAGSGRSKPPTRQDVQTMVPNVPISDSVA